MTDRELLGLAAKAAGIVGLQHCGPDDDAPYLARFYEDRDNYFRPLTDDGDALRLAVRLKMSIDHTEYAVHIAPFGDDQDYIVHEPIAASIPRDRATRRAIVRAAAEIGKGMK